MSSNSWTTSTLGNISKSVAYGYTESAKTEPIGPKFLRITDIVGGLNWDTVPYCKITPHEYEKYKLEIGDIVIARTGATTGTAEIIKEDRQAVFASYLIRFRIDETIADPFFVGHVLKSNDWKEFIKSSIGGSAQPGANATVLSGYEILLPPLLTQRRIANILSALDEKIELNRQTNTTLEGIAQTIFKEWFVDFNFPNATGAMVESDLRIIPQGWRVEKLGNLSERITKGTTPTTLGEKFTEQGVAFLRVECIQDDTGIDKAKALFISAETHEKLKRSQLAENDILLTIAGSIGRMGLVTKRILPANTNQAIGIIRVDPSLIPVTYAFYYLKQKNVKDELLAGITQSVQANISLTDLSNIKIILPPKELTSQFDSIAIKIQETIENLTEESIVLAALRDTLLPKLMSGDVDL